MLEERRNQTAPAASVVDLEARIEAAARAALAQIKRPPPTSHQEMFGRNHPNLLREQVTVGLHGTGAGARSEMAAAVDAAGVSEHLARMAPSLDPALWEQHLRKGFERILSQFDQDSLKYRQGYETLLQAIGEAGCVAEQRAQAAAMNVRLGGGRQTEGMLMAADAVRSVQEDVARLAAITDVDLQGVYAAVAEALNSGTQFAANAVREYLARLRAAVRADGAR